MEHGSDGVLGTVLGRLGLPAGLISPLRAHADAVARESPRLGLVSTGDEQHIVERHSADSLLFALALPPKAGDRWVDVGSGGGFPGLVLAVCYPQTLFTLVDSNRRKAGFLEMAAIDLGLANVEVRAERAERLETRFDVGVSRAQAEPDLAVQILSSLVKPGGTVIVAATRPVDGTRVISLDLPEVDSPRTLLMMTRPL